MLQFLPILTKNVLVGLIGVETKEEVDGKDGKDGVLGLLKSGEYGCGWNFLLNWDVCVWVGTWSLEWYILVSETLFIYRIRTRGEEAEVYCL